MTWTTTTDDRDSDERIEHQSEEEREAVATRILNAQKNNVEAMTKVEVIKKPVVRKAKLSSSSHDPVNHPKHYTEHPSGIECIQITEHMGFNLGNAMKYIWRADLKHNAVEDLQKAVWYINREIEKRSK